MSIQLNPKQIETLKAYRQDWVEAQSEIARLKENQKESLEALFDNLGYDKDKKEEKKAIKQGFVIFYKDSIKETEKLAEDAVAVASL